MVMVGSQISSSPLEMFWQLLDELQNDWKILLVFEEELEKVFSMSFRKMKFLKVSKNSKN